MNLEELEEKARQRREYLKKYWRDHYWYARKLGFPAAKSALLQKSSKKNIKRLAEERDEINKKEGH